MIYIGTYIHSVMDEQNQWLTEPEPEELTYMYHQEEHSRMQEQFVGGPLLEPPVHFDQFNTTPMASSNPFHPSQGASFPSFGGSELPSLTFGAAATKNEPRMQPSPSSSNVLSFAGQAQGATLDFSGRTWQQDDGVSVFQQPPERRSRAPVNAQEHVIAERKRREKLQQQFVALATIVPGLKKTDKISLLGSTIDYVKQLEEKVKTLEEQHGTRRTAEPTTAFESKCRITADDDDDDDAGPSGSASGADDAYSPTVEANIHGSTVLLKICCKERRGLLVMVLSELENHGLSIINTSVVPFTDSCLNITITAKVEEGFSTAVELVKNLTVAVKGFK
ncbi:transcription factor bHLH19-like isoform X1 [Oryza brachyantha]|uniref:transcription factor bHLH19-like isoform X1 n=2 Tax=Oryza brachyantha TaxID=4533 RepID=UPI0007768A9E|nr:transcription factor bHLH19-like isoform X1 [Oryza brachyantha]